MATHYSALKRLRQNKKRAERNKAFKTHLRHAVRELRRALEAKDLERAKGLVSQTVSLIDRSLKKGVIKENTAGRYKSRLMARLARLQKAA